MSEIKIRVESTERFFARARAVARRIDAGDRDVRAFGLSFTTPEQMFSLLTAKRWRLLGELRRHGPWSIRALAGALGRDYKAVHTDVTKLIDAGLIDRDGKGLISVPWTKISAEMTDDVEAA
jgi:predicted transcriptional regulator